MNTVRSDEIIYPCFDKNEHQKEGKLFILVCSNSDYLLGIFHGYCHVAGCKMEALSIDNSVNFFFNALKEKSPSVVFIDMEYAEQIVSSIKWKEISLLLDKNKIALCGIEKQSANNHEIVPQSVFTRVFIEPLNIEEIHYFLDDRITANVIANYERRSNERRRGDRRKDFRQQQAATISISEQWHGGITPDNQPEFEGNRLIGPMVINNLAKTITVNGIPLEISPKEYQFIELLAQKPNCVVTVEEIIKKVWPENKRATNADVHQYAYILRNKLEKNPHEPKLLITVKGFGYKLCP